MSTLEKNLKNREWLLNRLKAEVVGPDPTGKPFEVKEDGTSVLSWDDFPIKQKNGEEILWEDGPLIRYGSGILFSQEYLKEDYISEEDFNLEDEIPEMNDDLIEDQIEMLEKEEKRGKEKKYFEDNADESDESEVSLANEFHPSALGLSFLIDLSTLKDGMIATPFFAEYIKRKILFKKNDDSKPYEKTVWLRKPAEKKQGINDLAVSFSYTELQKKKTEKIVPGFEKKMKFVLISREQKNKTRLVTLSLINMQKKGDKGSAEELAFFQCGFKLKGISSTPCILPYPEHIRKESKPDDEESINRFLYREKQTYAIGHGCSPFWKNEKGEKRISELGTDTIPTVETPPMSGDIKDHSGNPIRVSMRKLAGLDSEDNGETEIQKLCDEYHLWIEGLQDLDNYSPKIENDSQKETARFLIKRCFEFKNRIQRGIDFLKSNSPEADRARNSFKLMNHAMLLSQLRSSTKVRNQTENGEFDTPMLRIDPTDEIKGKGKGYWRAFQIAFILMSIPGICDPKTEDRDTMDLLWFPTGGGKTEAYLGLASFTIFYNRMSDMNAKGTDVLMRYTLRLLTSQQFERASVLMCAMEYLRWDNLQILGEIPFKLGLWVGSAVTPNSRKKALTDLKTLEKEIQGPKNSFDKAKNPFVLLKCPWCNANIGPYNFDDKKKKEKNILGYIQNRKTVTYECTDRKCDFGIFQKPIPVVVIDEDIYKNPPNLLIGTVDKFAGLAWDERIRTIFGIDDQGNHSGKSPSLIIQDELHLISGPLGTIVGAYEPLIEFLSTKDEIKPKIIGSTATISSAKEQILGLYARENVDIFPPPGLNAKDSFFSKEDEGGAGRLYAGVMGTGYPSSLVQQTRIFACILQFVRIMETENNNPSELDPWWTLLCFYNSLRELGRAATLLTSDTMQYIRNIMSRHGIPYSQIRGHLTNYLELTSRQRSDQIPVTIKKLEQSLEFDSDGKPTSSSIGVCLCSNIIEVGIDIERLSIMSIIGQPKTTSQYIQVSSRIGRNRNAPGLVVVQLNPFKPRDRSHYEGFRSFHERFYAQVEPTSVTPFSPPSTERTLHALITAVVRQMGKQKESSKTPRPFPLDENSNLYKKIRTMLLDRVKSVDENEYKNVEYWMHKRLEEWKTWDLPKYETNNMEEDAPLLYTAGKTPLEIWNGKGWPTLRAMRNVDANCEAEITDGYHNPEEEN